MKVILKKISIRNFKGMHAFDMEFDSSSNMVYGANGTGKTTIEDAFRWCLFGTNAKDEAQFDIKPIDHQTGKPIPKRIIEVKVDMEVDGSAVTCERRSREKYNNNNNKEVFIGNETECSYNEVPLSVTEYKAKIEALLPKNIFKICTSPTYFASLGWQEQLQILKRFSGFIPAFNPATNEDVANLLAKNNNEIEPVIKIIKKRITDLIKESAEIPVKIEEVSRQLLTGDELEQLSVDNSQLNAGLKELSDMNMSVVEQEKIKQQPLQELLEKINKLAVDIGAAKMLLNADNNMAMHQHQQQLAKLNEALRLATLAIEQAKTKYKETSSRNAEYKTQREEILADIERVSSQALNIDPNAYNCPSCNRPLEQVDMDKLEGSLYAEFNSKKSKQLGALREKLEAIENNIVSLTNEMSEIRGPIGDKLVQRKEEIMREITKAEAEKPIALTTNEAISKMEEEAAALKDKLNAISQATINTQGVQSVEIQQEIRELNGKLTQNNATLLAHKNSSTRRKELLLSEEAIMNKKSAEERNMRDIKAYEKMYKEQLLTSINGKFKMVTWKLFHENIDGTEIPTCMPLVDNVPYSTLNTATQINAGIDIINTFSELHDFYAPVFIDNRERVSEIIATTNQIINLIVSPSHKSLTILK